jgi:hypothetical protein
MGKPEVPEQDVQSKAAVESKRLLDAAFDQGLMARSRRIAGQTLPPSKRKHRMWFIYQPLACLTLRHPPHPAQQSW